MPGATHDLTAARVTGLTTAGMMTFADRGYQGAGGSIRTPFKGHRLRPPLSRHQRSVNRAHARIRACGERAVATLKTWKVLARLAAVRAAPPRSCRPSCSCSCEHALDVLTHDGSSRSAAIRQAVLEAALRKERAAAMRRAVLRMPLGEPDGIDIAAEIAHSREDEG